MTSSESLPPATNGATGTSALDVNVSSKAVQPIAPENITLMPTPTPLSDEQAELQTRIASGVLAVAIAVTLSGVILNLFWLGWAGAIVCLIVSFRLSGDALWTFFSDFFTSRDGRVFLALSGLLVGLIAIARFSIVSGWVTSIFARLNWEAVGALGEVVGAIGQILIAALTAYIAWRQYIISKDLTIQQNRITQQQTIDAYFQGISELVLDSEGLLEDWPQERTIAEGRTAAIFGSIDADGKAKVLRFLSRSRLLTPLKRDRILGRAIFDGIGGYQEDRDSGVRVIDLGVMLADADLSNTDLRWTDLSGANLIRANLSHCELVKANFSRSILYKADLSEADMKSTRLFYGNVATASPRSKGDIPNYRTGTFTGAVVEGADFSGVTDLSDENRQYCCAWGGPFTRSTIPGGCADIPNKLELEQ